VRLVDYDFAFSRPLTRGRHTIRFDDAGRQAHEVIVEQLAPGRTLAEAMAADSSAPGPSPTEPFGGIGLLPPGGHVAQSADFDAGTYVLTCWIDDAKDGKSHREHGMVKAITVE
jgi:hypothetical protein